MPDITLTEKTFDREKIHLMYSHSTGLYMVSGETGDKMKTSVTQAEKDFGIPVLDTLIEAMQEEKHGDIETCPACNVLNAYAWSNSNMDCNKDGRILADDGFADGGERYTEDECIFLNADADIYHIPTASAFEWSCGKCRNSFAPADSPIMAEVYTH